MAAMREMMQQLKLTVNETKTRICRLPDETFDFLGYTFGRCYSTATGGAYLGTAPSKKSIQRVCREISELTDRRGPGRTMHEAGGRAEPETARLGELLLLGTVSNGLSTR